MLFWIRSFAFTFGFFQVVLDSVLTEVMRFMAFGAGFAFQVMIFYRQGMAAHANVLVRRDPEIFLVPVTYAASVQRITVRAFPPLFDDIRRHLFVTGDTTHFAHILFMLVRRKGISDKGGKYKTG
jgi:hypothetical protein